MSNLVPEKRVNKNGVAVTRHVRLNKRPTGLKPPIPSPSLSKARQERVAALLELIGFEKLDKQKTVDERNRIKKAAQSLTDEDIAFAEALVDGARSSQGKQARRVLVRKVLESGNGYSRKLRTAEGLLQETKMPPAIILSFLNTINGRGDFDESIYSLSEADDETKRKVYLLADTVNAMISKFSIPVQNESGWLDMQRIASSDGNVIEFVHPELRDAIIAHPERSMEIVNWYRERQYQGSLDELLNSVPALGSGAL